jgi:hypothetical protein
LQTFRFTAPHAAAAAAAAAAAVATTLKNPTKIKTD